MVGETVVGNAALGCSLVVDMVLEDTALEAAIILTLAPRCSGWSSLVAAAWRFFSRQRRWRSLAAWRLRCTRSSSFWWNKLVVVVVMSVAEIETMQEGRQQHVLFCNGWGV